MDQNRRMRIALAIEYGDFLILDDSAEERTMAEKSFRELEKSLGLSCARYLHNYPSASHAVNRGQAFNTIAHAVITDLMFGENPEGLTVALQCLAEGTPCVVVSRDNDHEYRHLPDYLSRAIESLRKLGVPVFLSSFSEPKEWRKGFEKLANLLIDQWLKEDSHIGAAVRRRKKFVWDKQPQP